MNILFLDVDGVLNNAIIDSCFSSFNMKNLQHLVNSLSLNVVISSDWRRSGSNLALLRSELNYWNIEIFGTTIISNGLRKNEIKHWLKTNSWSKALILDDLSNDEVNPDIQNCIFHQTDYNLGLTEQDVDTVIERWKKF